MMNDKERRVIKRVGRYYKVIGFCIFPCEEELKEVFDILAIDIHPGDGSSRLIKVQVDDISMTVKEAVRGYKTRIIKEIWLIKYGEKKTHPGQAYIYRYSGSELIKEPKDLPLDDALKK